MEATEMEATETWLDVMPAIELARGVPVVHTIGAWGTFERCTNSPTVVLCTRNNAPGKGRPKVVEWNPRDLRVDLDDPQGFGYALRWLFRHDGLGLARWAEHRADRRRLLLAWLAGPITDGDRLDLAWACVKAVT